jgi:hypothetical protein
MGKTRSKKGHHHLRVPSSQPLTEDEDKKPHTHTHTHRPIFFTMLIISQQYKRAKEGNTSREEEPRDGTDRCNDEDSCYHVLLVTAVEVVVETRDGLLVRART